ncbi:MAG: glycoside hydrolase family 16 protein [Clostridia bacterium]|nr:glycoside hydrolase family 16 protein [Clostridia bacterium]
MFSAIKRFFAVILSGIIALGASVDLWPYHTGVNEIDMSKFELVFEDEFDGTQLSGVWRPHHFGMGATIARKGSYWNPKLTEVYDGNLHIKAKYLEKGAEPGDPAGWYTEGLETNGSYRQKYGYFEVRCKLPSSDGLWSAFWMWDEGAADDNAESGVNGSEIDVFESMYYDRPRNNVVSANIHTRGYNENHRQLRAKKLRVPGDPYNEYNTYGVEWNSDEYIFYLNGKEWYRTDFDTPSQVDEFLILSVELSGENGTPRDASVLREADFVVDYVRAYQYK